MANPSERVWVPASETPAGSPAEDDHEAPLFALGVVQVARSDGPRAPKSGMVPVCLVEDDGGNEVVWATAESLVPANPETLDGAEDIGKRCLACCKEALQRIHLVNLGHHRASPHMCFHPSQDCAITVPT